MAAECRPLGQALEAGVPCFRWCSKGTQPGRGFLALPDGHGGPMGRGVGVRANRRLLGRRLGSRYIL